MSRFACLYAPHFVAAAHERIEPRLRDAPLAILAGAPPASRVIEATAAAREHAVVPGMTYTEARARCPALVGRWLAPEAVASARQALLDAALGVSPRVEDAAAGVVHVDIVGLARLFGDDAAIADRLVRVARAVGLRAIVGIADSRIAARIAAGHGPRRTGRPSAGDRAWLARAPIASLALEADTMKTLVAWGVRTLGDLAALPRAGIGARLGPRGLEIHDLALGIDMVPFRPYAVPPFWQEAQGVEWEIDAWPALEPVLGMVLDRLSARLEAAHVHADRLDVRLGLASGDHDVREIALAYPMRQVKPMLALIGLELEARPPVSPIVHVAVSAHALRAQAAQAGLWHPASPAIRDLATTVARLAVLVGRGNVGSPVVEDAHRTDAFTMAVFSPSSIDADAGEPVRREDAPVRREDGPVTLAFRRLRPPRPVDVDVADGAPVGLTLRDVGGAVTLAVRVAAGPWRTSGEWWDERAWARDEWDAVLADGMVCRLAHDRVTNVWFLDGAYD